MTLIKLNKILEGKYPSNAEPKENAKRSRYTTQEELEEFRQMLAISPVTMQLFQDTDSHTEFYKACELFSKVIDKDLQEDVFYAAKLGFAYEGVPSKLVYLLRTALREAKAPNLAVECINKQQLAKYLNPGVLPDGIMIKQIMSNLLGTDFKLLTSARRKVQYKDFYEVYVENVDRVLLLPEDLAKQVSSREDLCNVNYKEGTGVCVYDRPLRTLCGRLGITKHEFDLRECI